MSVGVNRETSLSRRAPSNKSEPAASSLGSGQVGKSRVQSGLSQGRDVESPLCARTVPSAFAAPLMPAMRSGRMLPRVLSPPPRELSREPSKRDPASARGKMDSGPLCAKMPPSNNPPPPPPPPPMALPKDARSWFRMALPAKVEKSCCPLPVAAEVSSCSQLPALMGKIPAPLWGKMEPSNIPPPPPPPLLSALVSSVVSWLRMAPSRTPSSGSCRPAPRKGARIWVQFGAWIPTDPANGPAKG